MFLNFSGSLVTMAAKRLGFFFFLLVILHAVSLLPNLMSSTDEEEDNLLQGINSFRTSQGIPVLTKNKKVGCLADEIAEELEDQPCTTTTTSTSGANYDNLIKKCGIDPNTTREGVVLPVCVPKLVPTLVLTNYTRSPYARYFNNSKYTGAGVGSEDDWMVVVLSTNTPGGSFVSEAANSYVGLKIIWSWWWCYIIWYVCC